MESQSNDYIWTNYNRDCYYLIQDKDKLAPGEFTIFASNGRKKEVAFNELAHFEITEEAAKSYMQAQMNQILEQVKNSFSNLITLATAKADQENPPLNAKRDGSGANFIAELLELNIEDIYNNPEIAKQKFHDFFVTGITNVIRGVALEDSTQIESAQTTMHKLQVALQSQGFDVGKLLEDIREKLREQLLKTDTEEITEESIKKIVNCFTIFSKKNNASVFQSDTSSQSTLKKLTDFFKADGWSFQQTVDGTTLQLSCQGRNGQWNCYTKVNEDQQTFLFYSICPIPSPEPQRPTITEFITRANYGMVLGNFELDYTDGEIRYKTSIDVEGSTLTPALIRQLVYTNVLTLDQYLPGILAILEQNATPEQAIHLVEQREPTTDITA